MSREISWQAQALDDFNEILAYLAERSQAGADAIERKVASALDRLSHRSIGRPGRVDGLFEKPVTGTSYTIAYALTDTAVVVLRVVHQSRDWPEGGWPVD